MSRWVMSTRRRGGKIGLWDVKRTGRGEDGSRLSSKLFGVVGPDVFRSRTRQARRRASDHRQQQHIIRYHERTARTNRETRETKRTENGQRGRQSSYRATESGARERKGNGCTLDHRPGHTITLRRGPPHAPSLGVGIGCSLLGAVLQDRKMLPVECWALVACSTLR